MYDRYPVHQVTSSADDCLEGWGDAAAAVAARARLNSRCVVAVECYPGVFVEEVRAAFEAGLAPDVAVDAEEAFLPSEELERRLAPYLGDDPVFGFMCPWGLEQFYDADRLEARRQRVASADGIVLVYGTGASLVAPDADVLVYADLTRWEIQQRQRACIRTAALQARLLRRLARG